MTIANPYLYGPDPTRGQHIQLKRNATIASMTVAVILIITKFIAYAMTDSVSILSSLMDSSFDALASLVTMLSVMAAAEPADKNHRFGHGKIEALAAAAQAIFIFGSSLLLLFEALHRFFHPKPVIDPEIGVFVMVLSIVLTLALIIFQKHVIHKTKSVAITADHLHYKGDLLMNLGVILTLGLGLYIDWPYFDPIFAVLVAAYLIWGARHIGQESLTILMDHELSDSEREKILHLASAHPKARAVHDLRTRSTGDRIFIEFHLEMDGELSLNAAHDVTEEIEKTLYDAFPMSEVIIHQEPHGIDDHRLDDQVEEAED